jgi:hypothetical protein
VNLDRYPIVEVDWLDSSGAGKGWSPLDFTEHGIETDHDRMPARSVGWLLHQCKACILIAPHFSNLASQPDNMGEMMIPRIAVKKITILKKGKR